MTLKHRIAASMVTGVMAVSLLAGCSGAPSPSDSAPAASTTESAPESTTTDSGTAGALENQAEKTAGSDALVIAEQGIFSAGGTVLTSDGTFDVANYYTSREGSTSHVDHANVFYQIPEEETGLPMVFLHGYGQSRMGWMTTPDGREGWSDLFLKMGHSVYLIDQPRRGEAGQTSAAGTISTAPQDQTWYTQFRIGTYLNDQFTYNENSQFPQGEDALDQFFRQMTPDTGMDNVAGDQMIDNDVVAQAVAAAIDEVYERTGKESILVTHSQGGGPGWTTVLYTDHIAAVIAIEPGGAAAVDSDEYTAMLEQNIPVIFYYGDYIGEEYTDVPAAAMWSMMASSADAFTAAYQEAGGNSTIIHLPDEGIHGNSHFMFQEMNNDVIAGHVEAWIQANVPQPEETGRTSENTDGGTLVVYYSATGNTKNVAEAIAAATGGDLFELEPEEPYSEDDLNWTDENSRVSVGHDNPDERAVALTAETADNWDSYENVYIGYPIWWGIAAWPVDTFVKANDFTGKTVIPFATSSSSGLGESGELLTKLAGTGQWLEGQRFRSGASESEVTNWINSLQVNQ